MSHAEKPLMNGPLSFNLQQSNSTSHEVSNPPRTGRYLNKSQSMRLRSTSSNSNSTASVATSVTIVDLTNNNNNGMASGHKISSLNHSDALSIEPTNKYSPKASRAVERPRNVSGLSNESVAHSRNEDNPEEEKNKEEMKKKANSVFSKTIPVSKEDRTTNETNEDKRNDSKNKDKIQNQNKQSNATNNVSSQLLVVSHPHLKNNNPIQSNYKNNTLHISQSHGTGSYESDTVTDNEEEEEEESRSGTGIDSSRRKQKDSDEENESKAKENKEVLVVDKGDKAHQQGKANKKEEEEEEEGTYDGDEEEDDTDDNVANKGKTKEEERYVVDLKQVHNQLQLQAYSFHGTSVSTKKLVKKKKKNDVYQPRRPAPPPPPSALPTVLSTTAPIPNPAFDMNKLAVNANNTNNTYNNVDHFYSNNVSTPIPSNQATNPPFPLQKSASMKQIPTFNLNHGKQYNYQEWIGYDNSNPKKKITKLKPKMKPW